MSNAATRVKKSEKENRKAKLDTVKHQMNGHKLLGSIVTFETSAPQPRKHVDVVAALTNSGLDPKFARELLPKSAFSRACKKLSEDAVIDVIKSAEDYIRFQFTKKEMRNEEWEYTKDTELRLNTITGEIECKKKELQKKAKELLDKALEDRTTTDITQIVNRLCDNNTDLFSVKSGVYFVPEEKAAFMVQIDEFLQKIGGHVDRFPVPAGIAYGEKAVKESVANAFDQMIEDHKQAIDLFTVSTRADTMQNAAKRIQDTRIKIEAYAHLLKDRHDKLLKSVEDAKKELDKKIEHLTEEKKNLPSEPQLLCGKSVSAVLKWMGANEWEFEDAKRVVSKQGFQIADTTITGQLWIGKSGRTKWGKPAELSEKDIKELEKLRKEKK
jgi:hypothetical protein